MKLDTFNNRTKAISKGSNAYNYSLALLTGAKVVYTCHTSGSGRFTTNIDRTKETIDVLQRAGLRLGIDFVQDNDSPRGGRTGNFIKLTSKGKRKMIK